ncbi:unnamed protein product [Caenorhabditis auriculariae]|uniref:Uncharacterized protein n=1 Tax=Caenorhabditis auriculariae TaxID=2777116 RepID=A0A8S1H6G1_9PELO|nr:unnamed protein product [Caenorhabditis auriculariae]
MTDEISIGTPQEQVLYNENLLGLILKHAHAETVTRAMLVNTFWYQIATEKITKLRRIAILKLQIKRIIRRNGVSKATVSRYGREDLCFDNPERLMLKLRRLQPEDFRNDNCTSWIPTWFLKGIPSIDICFEAPTDLLSYLEHADKCTTLKIKGKYVLGSFSELFRKCYAPITTVEGPGAGGRDGLKFTAQDLKTLSEVSGRRPLHTFHLEEVNVDFDLVQFERFIREAKFFCQARIFLPVVSFFRS